MVIRRSVLAAALVAVTILAGCTEGTTGIFADIEQEEEISSNNLVDNTFVASVVRADTGAVPGPRYFVVAGTKLFSRNVDGSSWSGVSSPSGYPLAQHIAAVDNRVFGVFRRSEADRYGIFRLSEDDDTWESDSLFDPNDPVFSAEDLTRVTGLAGIGTDGAPRLLATVSGASSGSPRFVAQWDDPSTGGASDAVLLGIATNDDLGGGVPVGKAFTDGEEHVWIVRNGLAYQNAPTAVFARVRAPVNISSAAFVPDPDNGDSGFIAAVTRGGAMFRSPMIGPGEPDPTSWDADDWGDPIGSLSRALAEVTWVPSAGDAGMFLVGTISTRTPNDRTRRGYYHGIPNGTDGPFPERFSSVSFSEPGGSNYRSAELSNAAVSRIITIESDSGGGTTVFALTENNGLWRSGSYAAGQNASSPDWTWE